MGVSCIKSPKESGCSFGYWSTVLAETVMARYPVLEGSLYWPSRAAYHVTTWMSDGSLRESWRPGPVIPRPILFNPEYGVPS